MGMQPKLRFKGFTDDWEKRRLIDNTKLITKGTTPKDKSGVGNVNFIKVENLSNNQIHPVQKISQEEHDSYLKRSRLQANDILFSIAGTLGRIAIVSPSLLPANTNQALSIIRGYDFDSDFLITSLSGHVVAEYIRKNPTVGAQPNLSLEQVGDLIISSPIEEEQEKIGSFFKLLNHLITVNQRKVDLLKKKKAGYLQKLFPRNGQNKPELRFKGYTDAWEKRKLGELTKRVTRKNINNESTLPLTISAQYGLIDQNIFFDKQVASKDVSSYFLIKNGEFAYNKSYSNGYPLGAIKRLDRYPNGVLSTLYIIFKPISVSSQFLVSYFDSTHWYKEVAKNAAEGARNHGLLNISPSDFFNMVQTIPNNFEEQNKVGIFFETLDNIIAVNQRKVDLLKKEKKSLLQKMFV